MDTALLFALGLLAQSLDLSLGVPGLRRPSTLFPWRRAPSPGRVRRAWVIPPISVSENYKRLPYPLVQIKSDKQQLGSVIYSIQGPGVDEEPRGVFSIDKFTGKVFLNALLDREKMDRFRVGTLGQLRAFALDLGGSTLEEPTDLEIVVVDQNDNRPVFRQEVFTGQVLEGAVPGTYVTRAEATDADDPETDNAALRYSILEQGSPQLFSIDEHTGEIRTVQVGLDREVVAVYNLTLQVADMSGDGLTSTASAIITLEDVNDNAPGFTRDEVTGVAPTVLHGGHRGHEWSRCGAAGGGGQGPARLPQLGSQVHHPGGRPDGHFAIRTDPKTNEGVLSVVKVEKEKESGGSRTDLGQQRHMEAFSRPHLPPGAQSPEQAISSASSPQPLDYESCDQYDLKVEVQNEVPLQAAAPRAERDQARVSVQVRDVNEAPVFQENPLRTSLAEGAAPGTPVATFSARDPDTQQLQRLSYSKDYDPEDWLQVDGATGWVQTQSVLSPASPFLKDGWYRAIILAYDDASPPCTATGTLSIEILEVNDHAPELSPSSGSLCSEPDQGSGLLLGATDEDLPPHGAPFHFQLSPRVPELARNWSLSQINMGRWEQAQRPVIPMGHGGALLTSGPSTVSHARLRLRHQVQEGLHRLSLLLQDSGQPPQHREQLLNVTVCHCGQDGVCLQGAAALRAKGTGISLGALVIMLASVVLLFLLALPVALLSRFRQRSWDKGLLQGLQDDLRDNILNYDEQGGGEEDQDAYDISQLRHPSELAALSAPLGRPLLRRDTPFSWGLEAADSDLSVPPYDTALIYDYEGDGSMAGTLSSILSSLADEDQDYSCLQDWGPRFARLADLYGPP
ncbi:hypothetical protein QTO34_010537 [Cnephaeus nilssonii]|uniref:Cadherin domain-containing protein n=1 Tax=Cnephaeus nilssonii TaxID=3371016 RepID=A0AA40HFQ1_CNENI|nr:hypothetical protein QTO34_010537 [Eptesicus nilssonii]